MIELLTQVKGVTAGTDTTLTLRFGRLMFLVFGADFTETVYSKSSGARGRQILLKQTSAVVTVDIVTVIVLITISNHILMAMWKHAIKQPVKRVESCQTLAFTTKILTSDPFK